MSEAADARRLQNAAEAIRSLRTRVAELEGDRTPPVAVVGVGCRFPGADGPDAYWRLLRGGESAIREVPADRWDIEHWYDPDPSAPGRMSCRAGGFLDAVDLFDAEFFGVSPREARRMDPQQRLLLEVSWEALENAGIDPLGLDGSATGVFTGIAEAEYLDLLRRSSANAVELHDVTGTSASVASGRLSYHLGLAGPNLALDTACSSSLVAVHLAVRMLRAGESDLALAGGANVMLSPETFVAFCKAGALAPDGRCKPFDSRADGYGRGEGCGIVVLKRLSDARADGDRILAVIRGTAVNHDGRTNGLTAPDGRAQQAVILAALADGGVAQSDIGFVEAHGTGTPLGDTIEADALGEVFGGRGDPLPVGAVKANIGHLEAAAGVAGLIKAILALEHGELPGQPDLRELNPMVEWDALPLRAPDDTVPLDPTRLAGVSSFGFSGTNAHVVLERAPEPASEPVGAGPERPQRVLTLAARTPEALRALAGRYAEVLQAGDVPWAATCATANTGRSRLAHRLAVVAASGTEASEALRRHSEGNRSPGASSGHAVRPPRVAFLFPGQGGQHAGMARGLYTHDAGFRQIIDRCDAALREALEASLVDLLYGDGGDLDRTANAQPALFAVSYALAQLWRGWGVEPAVVLGHSTGELVAACVAGAVSLEDALELVAGRARLVEEATGDGAAAAVFAPAERVEAVVGDRADVGISAVNGPRETVVAGTSKAIEEARTMLKRAGLESRPLSIPHAPHSPLVEPVLDALETMAARIAWRPVDVPLISNVTGRRIASVDAAYWRTQLRAPVRFVDALAALADEKCTVMLEVGPQPVLQLLGRQAWTGADVRWISSLWEGHDDWRQIMHAARDLFTAGVDLDWEAIEGARHRRVALPTYPFERSRYWVDDGTRRKPVVPPQVAPAAPAAVASPAAPATGSAIFEDLVERLAALLESEPAKIDADTSFVALGADSLVLARLVQDVEDAHGVHVGLGRLFDDLDTPRALVAHVVERAPAPALRDAPPSAAARNADDDTARLINRQLDLMQRQLDLLAARESAERPRLAPEAGANGRPPRREPQPAVDLTVRQRRHLDELVATYRERTRGSLARARARATDGRRADTRLRVVRPETRALAYPIVASEAHGARFCDIDGNEYVDLAMGVGVLLCGHDPPFVREAVARQHDRGLQTGPIVDLADEVAEDICAMTGMQGLFFGVTGTSAVRGALRIAQAATDRSRFAMFAGSYHGQDDRVLAVPDVLGGDAGRSVPMAVGISPSAAADALVLPYGSERALRAIEEHATELAAVLVEPVQSRNPGLQPASFIAELRRLTERLDVPLVFDEVITGFRIHPRGAQGWFGVQADIAAYGKCLAGGLPLSVVAGSARYIDRVDGGAWDAGLDRRPDGETTYIGSTFEMHPLAMAAAHAMLRHLRSEGPDLQRRLNDRTERLADRLDALFDHEDVPIRVLRFGSVFRFAWKGNASYAYQPLEIELFHLHLVARGIYLWEGRTCFLSTAHTDADLERVVVAACEAVDALRDGGFLSARSADAAQTVTAPAGAEQAGLVALSRAAPPDAPPWLVPERMRLRGPLRLDALRAAVGTLVARQEALRTVFTQAGEQVVRPSAEAEVIVEDVAEDALEHWLADALARPFDLAAGPMLRVLVGRVAPDVHDLTLLVHHAVCDGWSMAVLVEELATAYGAACEGASPGLEPPVPFRAFVERQIEHEATGADQDTRAYWLARFPDGFPTRVLLSREEGWPKRAYRHAETINPAALDRVIAAGRAHGCTLFMTLLAAHVLVVQAITRRTDIVVGTPVAARGFPTAGSVVGYCSHMLPIRLLVAAESPLTEYLSVVRAAVVEALAHQDVPFARLRQAIGNGRPHPFPFDTVFNVDRSIPCPRFAGLDASFERVPGGATLVPLRLDALEVNGALWLDCDVPTVSDAPDAAVFCSAFRAALDAIASGAALTVAELSNGLRTPARPTPAGDEGRS